ncbi:unnamed protein product [Paramecium pentaurelia]|uniref:Uncharacterized protein n=1 Tax=Paramecium pentaurelia TaxID=43138 RepID=A0A8S1S4U8_9CILI|nr:unnamed protein product [Paramecium pentaurelia]
MIMLHSSRSQSNKKRLSQQSSLINITELNKSRIQNSIILNKFNHIFGSIKSYDIEKEFFIYPPDLKDQQVDDFEILAFDEEFQKLSVKNQNYTKGALQCIQDILHMIFTQSSLFYKIITILKTQGSFNWGKQINFYRYHSQKLFTKIEIRRGVLMTQD